MCGFAGIVTWDNRHRVHRAVLEKMSARIAHRGPDGEGIWLNHEEEVTPDRPQVGLVHRRLAIIDLDPRANQPFTDGRGRWLVYNGEIYNYRELRKELEALLPNYAWRTTSDTEVLLASYAAWGEKCVEKLNGMFAFAIWDEGKGELFLARDRMGQKPLYFAAMPADGSWSAFAFASELSALRPVDWICHDVEAASVLAYLSWGYVPSPYTIFDGANQLMPGMTMRIRSAIEGGPIQMVAGRYFNPALHHDHRAFGEPAQTTRERLTQATKRQMVADVPLGCFLSGGMDSSIVAACMRQLVPPAQRILTFSIGFGDSRYDEREYAARVAEYLGTEHRSFVVAPNAAVDLPKLAAVFGEPFADSSALPTHYLSRETRQHVKVALSGDGGDELFGGYDRYRAMLYSQQLGPVIERIGSRIGRALPGGHPKSRGARAKRFLKSLAHPIPRRYLGYIAFFDEDLLEELWPRDTREKLKWEDDYELQFEKMMHIRDAVPAATAFDRKTYLPDDLLTKVDRCSMLHALEVRSPFMDHELVQFASTLTTAQLLKGGPKHMLREAFADMLPAWVFKRKKMGFAVPIGEWFRKELRPMLRDSLFAKNSFASSHFNMAVVNRLVEEHETQKVDHSQRLYALLMLELWWQQQ